MWEDVKPISVKIAQTCETGCVIEYDFYSHDYEVVKLNSATHKCDGETLYLFDKFVNGSDTIDRAKYFISKINNHTKQKLIEYYENKNLYLEFFI
jgi:hypothetical protein